MTKMATNDYTISITGTYQGSMAEFAAEINLVHARLIDVQDAFIDISQGDTSRLNEFVTIGKRSDNDQLLPSIIGTLTTIDNLIEESRNLAQAGINGNLEVRRRCFPLCRRLSGHRRWLQPDPGRHRTAHQ